MASKAQSAEASRASTIAGDGHSAGSNGEQDGTRRRDFLNVAAVSFVGVGAVAALAPLIIQMSPSADVLAMSLSSQ